MTSDFNRRDFLKTTALLPLAAAGLSLVNSTSAVAAKDSAPPKLTPYLKVSLASFSFSKLLDESVKTPGQGMDLFQLLEFCAKVNYDGLEATGYFFPTYPKVPPSDYLNDFKRKAFELGIGISGTGVRDSLTVSDKSKRDADVQHVKDWVEVAAHIGAPVLRVFADTQIKGETWLTVAKGFTHDQVEQWIADDIRECAEYAAKFGVMIGIQNHGDFLQTGPQLTSLVKRVGHEWCGPIIDTGYFKSADPFSEMAAAGTHAVNWLVKERQVGAPGDQNLDLKKLLPIIRASGYRGYLTTEALPIKGQPYDPTTAVPAFLARLRQAIKETA